jgi:hypothetical protein
MDAASRLIAWAGTPSQLMSGYTWSDAFWLLLVVTLLVGGTLAFWRQKKIADEKDLAILSAMSLPSYRQVLPRFQLELERVRRFERPLSILVVRMDGDEPLDLRLAPRREDPQDRQARIMQTCGSRIMFAHVGLILQQCLRDMDLTSCDVAERRYIVALPECTRAEASNLVERLDMLVRRGTGLGVRVGVAEVGSDGLVVADLVRKAAERSEKSMPPELTAAPFAETVANESRMSA